MVIGLGSMIGAGVFAAFAPAAAAAGGLLLVGLALAAGVAYCNAVASAQLAAQYPTSGGTYVYGRERLGEWWGFLAGWGFVDRQDGVVRRDGADVRRLRVPAARLGRSGCVAVAAVVGAHGGEPPRHHAHRRPGAGPGRAVARGAGGRRRRDPRQRRRGPAAT